MNILIEIKTLSKLFLFVILSLTITFCSNKKEIDEGNKQKPNILFIMSDDHAYQAISAYDTALIRTPNIDRLANEGMKFDRAFVTNSICAPSRAVILTGKFSHLNGVRDNSNIFDSTQQTFPKILQKSGYQTAMIGKWHLKTNPTGFDFWRVFPGQGHYYNPVFITPEGKDTVEGYATDIVTDYAINWLENNRDKSKPFLLMYQHKAPHREWSPSLNHLSDFHDNPLPEPATLFDDYSNRGTAAKEAEMRISDHMGLTNDNKIDPELVKQLGYEEFSTWYEKLYNNNYERMTDEQREKWDEVYGPINEYFKTADLSGEELIRWKYQRYMQDYLGTIKSVDDNVGRLLDYLDKTGLAENTIVVYTSDQGFYLGEHGWFDKRFMYKESFRTPLLIRWPNKIKEGTVNHDLVQNLDFAETFLEIAGVDIPNDMQGESLTPLFEENNKNWRDKIYYHYYEYPGVHAVKRHYGIRTDKYKLIHFYYDIDEWELYDLEKDPDEMNNVYDDPDYLDIQIDLSRKLEELRKEYKDSDELTNKILEHDLKR